MKPISATKRIDLTLQAHLAQYRAIRSEIETELKRENDLMNFAIAIVAGTITLSTIGQPPFISQQPILLLIVSTLLSAICWSLISMEMRIHDYRIYIDRTLRYRVQKLLGEDESDEYKVLRIEFAELAPKQVIRTPLRSFFFMGHYLVIYIPAVLFIGIFKYSYHPAGVIEYSLLILAIFMAIMVLIGVISNIIFVAKYYSK
jgi:hypothetical protein